MYLDMDIAIESKVADANSSIATTNKGSISVELDRENHCFAWHV
jgi:hypothetical protein